MVVCIKLCFCGFNDFSKFGIKLWAYDLFGSSCEDCFVFSNLFKLEINYVWLLFCINGAAKSNPNLPHLIIRNFHPGSWRRRGDHADREEPAGAALHSQVWLHQWGVRVGEEGWNHDWASGDREHLPSQGLSRSSRAATNWWRRQGRYIHLSKRYLHTSYDMLHVSYEMLGMSYDMLGMSHNDRSLVQS